MTKDLKAGETNMPETKKPETPVTHTLGWWIMESMRTGKSVTIPRADCEAIFQRYTAAVSPKIDELRRRQRPAPGDEDLKIRKIFPE